MLFLVLLNLVASHSLKVDLNPFSLSAPPAGPASCQDACYTGQCTYCNDICFDSTEGSCAQCWQFNKTLGMACLSNESSTPDCRTCWTYKPCSLCTTGSCAKCEACQKSRVGNCASCWEPDSQGYSCLLGYTGRDCSGCWNVNNDTSPVIMTSGLTASTLMATWKGVEFCKDSPNPTMIWPFGDTLTLTDLLCYTKLLRVTFDPATKTFHNLPGVNISVFDFGGFDGLSFGPLMGTFETFGYRTGVNMWGAPFDWRQSSQGSQQLYSDLQALVEQVFTTTKKKVVLLAPSYGPQVILGFLQLMSQEWKDTYLSWFIAGSPVWSGSSTALFSLASGLSLLPNSSALIRRAFRDMEVRMPSMMWLCPQPGDNNYTYPDDMPLILTPGQNYSAANLTSILVAVGYQDALAQAQYLAQSGSLYKFEPPLVNTWVSYGYNVETPITLTMAAPLTPSVMPDPVNGTVGSGDGIVSVRSSLRGMLWTEAQETAGKQMIYSGYDGMAHAACMLPVIDPNHTTCFYELMALLLNGTLPQPTPPP